MKYKALHNLDIFTYFSFQLNIGCYKYLKPWHTWHIASFGVIRLYGLWQYINWCGMPCPSDPGSMLHRPPLCYRFVERLVRIHVVTSLQGQGAGRWVLSTHKKLLVNQATTTSSRDVLNCVPLYVHHPK